ncbi:hypothetical protein EC957_005911 [Mortierella hygrophila]|uniref:Uncharacterized protein n=1 Tax=Mortierella hygrophila TaxID=979708 RepID=A0A9P6FE66_9FUNG|nr:hypothetical protein EC957_005911 [Mortierella hygrophila]
MVFGGEGAAPGRRVVVNRKSSGGFDCVLYQEVGLLSDVKRIVEEFVDTDEVGCLLVLENVSQCLERVSLEGARDFGYDRETLLRVKFSDKLYDGSNSACSLWSVMTCSVTGLRGLGLLFKGLDLDDDVRVWPNPKVGD